MAIKRPDIYEHNNPNEPIVDTDFVQGGFRTKVADLTALYALAPKINQMKEHATSVWVISENKYYTLVDASNVGNSGGWSDSVLGSGGGVTAIHNNLESIQGGTEQERYHLTEVEHSYLTDVVSNDTIGLILDAIAVPPTYVAPTNSISNVTQTVERGSTVSINITQTFTQNDAGALVSQEIQKDNVQVSTTSSFSENLLANAPTTVYRGLVTYAEGLTKLNNLGIPDPTGKITAGIITSAVRIVTTRLRQFFGSVSATPTNSAEVRALASNNFETTNQFNLETGTTNTTFIFAIPANKEKSLIIDTTNLNVDITSQYLLIDDEFVVNDIGGTPHNYKLYRMQVGAPYGTSANHQINVI